MANVAEAPQQVIEGRQGVTAKKETAPREAAVSRDTPQEEVVMRHGAPPEANGGPAGAVSARA
jgi:hypothetical protein